MAGCQVIIPEEGIIGIRGLFPEDIQTGSRYPTGGQRILQSLMIYDAAP
jgi:hypothetical protein